MRKRLRIMPGLHLARAAILARVARLGKMLSRRLGFRFAAVSGGSWTQLVQGFPGKQAAELVGSNFGQH